MYGYEKRGSTLKKIFTLVILMGVVSATSIYIYDMYMNIDVTTYQSNTNVIRLAQDQETTKIDEKKKITNTLGDVTKCVVGISKIKNNSNVIFSSKGTSDLGLGTGIIISDNGYILSNCHVTGNKYSNCYITLENGETHNGSVVWADSDLDLSIVKINIFGLDYLTLGDSDKISLGEEVYAIGNPIGLEFQRTVTFGIISGINRTIKIEEEGKVSYMEDLIQTDATINPGNSGGPLINISGEVIGINTVKISSAEGIGFAVPSNIIKPVIENYVLNGNFEEAYLGVFAFDKEVIPYLNSDIELNSGIYIAQISVDGPCNNTSLKVGDIVTQIDSCIINKMSELRNYIYTKKPNEEVTLLVLRNNKEIELKVVLGKKG